MIKITIIFVLILLLLITLYSYYCISSRIVNFERARLEYILQKESDINIKENKVKVITDCSNKNEQYQIALNKINNILQELNINEKQTITDDINFLITKEPINVEMLNEVPTEYINNLS